MRVFYQRTATLWFTFLIYKMCWGGTVFSWGAEGQESSLAVHATLGDIFTLWIVSMKWRIKIPYLFENKELDQFAYNPFIS